MKRGRPTKISRELVRRICGLLAKGSSIRSACIQVGLGERTYFDWQNRAKANEEPFARFFFAVTRAREQHQQRLIEVVMKAADRDAKHAEWLLERQFPREFAPYDRRPIPREEPTSGVKFIATLPSGATADIDEIWKVARQFHEAAQPRKQHEHEPKPTNDDEPMKHWYNPVTRRVEPIDNGEHEG